MTGYASHVWHDVTAERGESLRRVRVDASLAHVVETSIDGGETWRVTKYGAVCPRRDQ